MALNTLVDDVRYAQPTDVETYIRNKSFDGSSDPTKTEVERVLDSMTERVDTLTGRAWRTRKVADRELAVKFSHRQRFFSATRRRFPASGGGPRGRVFTRTVPQRGVVTLPHPQVRSIDSNAGDKVVVLNETSTTDITANEGRDQDEGWVLDERHGLLHIDIENFLVGPLEGSGLAHRPQVRVTYRYGTDESSPSTAGLSDSVPPDIREAVAMLTASKLLSTDQYGDLVVSGPENVPDQNQAAQNLREEAMENIMRYKYTARM